MVAHLRGVNGPFTGQFTRCGQSRPPKGPVARQMTTTWIKRSGNKFCAEAHDPDSGRQIKIILKSPRYIRAYVTGGVNMQSRGTFGVHIPK